MKEITENSDYVITRMLKALRTISVLADGDEPSNTASGEVKAGSTAVAFSEFEVSSAEQHPRQNKSQTLPHVYKFNGDTCCYILPYVYNS